VCHSTSLATVLYSPTGIKMTKAIDIIRRATSNERRSIEVPEWENLKLYFTRLSTLDIQSTSERNPKDVIERNIYLLIAKAQLEDGTPAFELGDRHFLLTADFMIVQRLIGFMFETASVALEDAKAAIKGDPTSAPASE
jgi:hypothetical protein